MKLALKVDVDTYVGTRLGVPALADLCERHDARATFLLSLGPDHTGRALLRVFRPGFLSKVRRTSVVEHYGLRTLLYGVLLPGPDIARRCAPLLRALRDRGFEVGVHAFDHVLWQDFVRRRDAAWTGRQMRLALGRFTEIFGHAPQGHGAAGGQMTAEAFALEEELGYRYASDTRGTGPFLPRIDGRASGCAQLPTTLPTLDELVGRTLPGGDDPVEHLLRLTATEPRRDHVFTLHAELEGRRFAPWFERLLDGWRLQGYEFTSLGGYHSSLDRASLPVREVVCGEIPGRSGTLSLERQDQACP
jgi:peptidoglycan/xylan/chitin deacetylase (PgdA/CDA1 family)